VIAGRAGVSTDALAQANNITDANSIVVGQRLVVPGGDGANLQVVAESTTTSDAAPPADDAPAAQSYSVASGDTLGGIASKFNTSPDALSRANGISDPDSLSIGQVLQIP